MCVFFLCESCSITGVWVPSDEKEENHLYSKNGRSKVLTTSKWDGLPPERGRHIHAFAHNGPFFGWTTDDRFYVNWYHVPAGGDAYASWN
ncbi:hypothetical protein AVEN_145135-1 [Araneus ventricosus]|uniref:Uncharacterized protein n=1 Tax=Araneus ventricosus TaxID=182803 RepID=A0A4Y2GNE9_ARAVE|nr:hypothetical protein AVEN_145135-1 [Araneus ventricosus]